MPEVLTDRIAADPRYAELIRRRSRFGWAMAAIMFAAYIGFILLVAFAKPLLATPIGDGVTTIGVPVGLGLIVAAIALTGLYVLRANRRFDRAMAVILRDAGA